MTSITATLQNLIWPGLRPLPPSAERAMRLQHDARLEQMLPLLGPLFGLGVMSFVIWDVLIYPPAAPMTAAVRGLAVLIGCVAYLPNGLRWSVARRCGHIYTSHACAIILCEYLLPQGLIYGQAGVAACVFALAVVTLRLTVFLRLLAAPSALYAVLCALRLSPLLWVSTMMQYLFAVGLAAVLMLVIRQFHQKAFLLEQELLHLSHHDSLTGACNRRYLEEVAERELALAQRHGRSLSVAMLDIDHFKRINDNYGHEVGDRVLQELVRCCTGELREIDHFGRLGGEEFVCVLPETGREEAQRCAERLRLSLAALPVPTEHGSLHFTVSIGVAVLDPTHTTWGQLLRDADQAMYHAKHGGRNRVVLANPPAGGEPAGTDAGAQPRDRGAG